MTNGINPGNQNTLEREPVQKLQRPRLYKVFFLNDDYTPMDFVVDMLQKYFHKELDEATAIMVEVHAKGIGLAGVYPLDTAESKVLEVVSEARAKEHPLMLVVEPE